MNVHLSQRGGPISPTLYGAFFEEINHAGEGGIYGELVRNRAFNESTTAPVGWSLVTSDSAAGSIALDASQPLNDVLPRSLKLQIIGVSSGQRVGAANGGYGGIALDPGASYLVSLYVKTADSPGALTVSLESPRGEVLAQTTLTGITASWQKFTFALTLSGLSDRTPDNRLVVAGTSPGTFWLSVISLFPQTWHGRPNLRSDIMNLLREMQPKLMRFPGGNYIEGNDLAQRWNWKQTIGDIAQRPGHNGPWGYFSSDGLGLHEYLQMCEDLGATPVLGLFAGYTLNRQVVAQSQLGPYVQDALDAIEYAIGTLNTRWGAQRAANGHPTPFNLRYVEIGNEDVFDESGSYNTYRFPLFYDAIKAQYPSIQVIATTDVSTRPPDVIDEHFYVDTPSLIDLSHRYDSYSRRTPFANLLLWGVILARGRNGFEAYAADDHSLGLFASPRKAVAAITTTRPWVAKNIAENKPERSQQ